MSVVVKAYSIPPELVDWVAIVAKRNNMNQSQLMSLMIKRLKELSHES